jgi:L-serine dehydratase
MTTSLFELFKIGIGPSSSHTVGPMVAARRFVLGLESASLHHTTNLVRVDLYGSLALTGQGHGADRAVLLGLYGAEPETVDTRTVESIIASARELCRLSLLRRRTIRFYDGEDIVFHCDHALPFHPNGMVFTAFDAEHRVLRTDTFYSIGGGFVVTEVEAKKARSSIELPFPFRSAGQLLAICRREDIAIWQLMLRNECALRTEKEVILGIDKIWKTMCDCTERGMTTAGILPGGLNVRRQAPGLVARLMGRTEDAKAVHDPLAPFDWVSVFAIAVNEENAAGGRVVAAPTNGAAGIIPAVGHYFMTFIPEADHDGILRYLLTVAAIGILYKENASIFGAEVGCQGEVGVAASMAAGALVAALGGSNEQVEHAAEIAMEHSLGMTCDPVGGVVKIPCIERNAMGAVKAINASRIVMNESGGHRISLDQVIETMYRTGLDIQSRYKETSLAGLALNVIEC